MGPTFFLHIHLVVTKLLKYKYLSLKNVRFFPFL